MKAAKSQFEDKPLKELQKLAEEVYGDGVVVSYTPADPTNGPKEGMVFLDTPETLASGECKIVIDDEFSQELLWSLLVEKRRLVRKKST